ncbi:MAG: hypothetical protein A3F14_02730 [Gammaproteobacteria bacterium RIFCSPHIGHO2_12_FULL_43_28]|nr:MAG: hypothetical protein A3F14_02730 [Gammaproteobacteria bacterium RIFCSPHIGHO2_12_FULL_43_28]
MLINAAQLDKLRKNPKNVTILEASWHFPTEGRDAKAEFLQNHIAGSRFLDLSAFHDSESPLPNMLTRDEALISERLGELGITNEHKIIFYDRSEHHTSCRALWMLKVFGHHPGQLYLLDGSYASWERYGGKIESGEAQKVTPKNYSVNYEARFIRSLVQMKANLHHPTEQVIDMRHPVRFAGGLEPRAGVRKGHIPGSFSFPYFSLFEPNGHFKSLSKIQNQLEGIGVQLGYPVITTCGSGMSAAVLNFILDLLNHDQHSLYDGAWTEWGAESLFHGEEGLSERPVKTCLE